MNGSVYYSYYVMYLFRPFKRFVAFLRWYVKFKTLNVLSSFFVQYVLDCGRSEYVAESMSIWFLILFERLWTQRNNAVSFFNELFCS